MGAQETALKSHKSTSAVPSLPLTLVLESQIQPQQVGPGVPLVLALVPVLKLVLGSQACSIYTVFSQPLNTEM